MTNFYTGKDCQLMMADHLVALRKVMETSWIRIVDFFLNPSFGGLVLPLSMESAVHLIRCVSSVSVGNYDSQVRNSLSC